MKYLLASVAASLSLFAGPVTSWAQGTNPFLGQVITVGFDFCPEGWQPMNGQLLAISQNQALFSLLGTTYGGDGERTFALPKALPVFTATRATFTQCISVVGIYPSRG